MAKYYDPDDGDVLSGKIKAVLNEDQNISLRIQDSESKIDIWLADLGIIEALVLIRQINQLIQESIASVPSPSFPESALKTEE